MATSAGTPHKPTSGIAASPWKIETHKLSKAPKHFDVNTAEVSKEVIVVTGGAGFLGQHIVKQIMEQQQFPVGEIRVFDIQPLKWFYGLKGTNEHIRLHHYQGDICNNEDLKKAFDGATVVIHNASLIDTTANPDAKKLHRVNVLGTEAVIEVSLKSNVEFLLYTSSISVGKGSSVYGTCKQRAEELVLKANSRLLNNGGKLRTCALRPVAMFGEGDLNVVFGSFKAIRRNTFIRLGDDSPRFQCAYAGNIAWAFVCALHRMRKTSDGNTTPVGRAIGIADGTPVTSFSRCLQPFIEAITKAHISRVYIPFWLLYTLATACEWVCYSCRPFYTLNLPLSRLAIISMYDLPIVDPEEAYQCLGYKPKYTYKDVYPICLRYYRYAYGLLKKQGRL